jgi:hypothetical protein
MVSYLDNLLLFGGYGFAQRRLEDADYIKIGRGENDARVQTNQMYIYSTKSVIGKGSRSMHNIPSKSFQRLVELRVNLHAVGNLILAFFWSRILATS